MISSVASQEHVARLMIIPSDSFCLAKGCAISDKVDSDGVIKPEIGKAIMESDEFVAILGKLNALFANSGFEVDNIQNELKKMSNESILTKLKIHGKENVVQETPKELLLRTSNVDFVLPLDFSFIELNGEYNLLVRLRCNDAYNGTEVAALYKSEVFPSTMEISEMLELMIAESLPLFIESINKYYEQLFIKGREVKMTLIMSYPFKRLFDENFTYNGHEQRLDSLVINWVKENSMNGEYSIELINSGQISFTSVHLPMIFTRNGRTRNMDSRTFVNSLRKYLTTEPFFIDSKAYYFGLGEAWLEFN